MHNHPDGDGSQPEDSETTRLVQAISLPLNHIPSYITHFRLEGDDGHRGNGPSFIYSTPSYGVKGTAIQAGRTLESSPVSYQCSFEGTLDSPPDQYDLSKWVSRLTGLIMSSNASGRYSMLYDKMNKFC